MKYIFPILTLSALMVLGTLPAQAAYFSSGDNQSLTTETASDAFLAGRDISISAPVLGEVFAAGNNLTINKRPARSLFVAGQKITVTDGVSYNTFAAGQDITLSGQYDHDVYIAGNTVTIADGTVIKGDLKAVANDLKLNGTVDGNVDVNGSTLNSNATVGGYVHSDVANVTFAGGTIGKDFSYTSTTQPAGLDKVKISGKTEKTQPKEIKIGDTQKATRFLTFTGWFFRLLSTLLLGALFILFMPKKVAAVSERVTGNWSQSLLIGALFLILTPLASALLFATLIGWPVAVALLILYVVALLVLPVFSSFIAGGWILGRLGDAQASWWAKLLVGALVIAALKAIPIFGGVISTLVFIGLTLPAIGASIHWYREHLA